MSRWLGPARAYARAFEELTPETLPDLVRLWTEDVVFKDPFNEAHGHAASLAVYRHMYATTDAPRFQVLDVAASESAAYLKWRMTFRPKGKPESWTIEGMSELLFAEDGRVRAHLDHWDAASQLYEKVTGLCWLMRLIKRRLTAPSAGGRQAGPGRARSP
ncbi:MAG: nuclear transport factor 2 family protein [Alphaproteobacteria bacterium]|nr:nuclear transport factor 2 family protein [Alphaproteobacteria bacterium]